MTAPKARTLQERMGFDPTMSLDAVERAHILHVMDFVEGDKVRAAHFLEINLSTLYRKLARYQLEDEWRRKRV